MRALVFAACILAAAMMSDAQIISHVIEILKSKQFDIRELISFRIKFIQCAVKLGVLKGLTPEILVCIAQKNHLIDEEGGLIWDKVRMYITKLIRNPKKLDDINEICKRCKEEGDKVEGTKYEKTLKSMECGVPTIRYILQQI
ncbi:PREDICTED: uncharacterized protein LOC105562482 [Vollenhovia emeryi]|uniref:uncharacterized protein LOC105562482 n=1 Tax=Vollenhovia emeryi TaxID=411798 RepID=UPI0005F41C1E|nr:PREDICTED: uncharacterized protein LOC105562482 [Vollenhovia emeryi]